MLNLKKYLMQRCDSRVIEFLIDIFLIVLLLTCSYWTVRLIMIVKIKRFLVLFHLLATFLYNKLSDLMSDQIKHLNIHIEKRQLKKIILKFLRCLQFILNLCLFVNNIFRKSINT